MPDYTANSSTQNRVFPALHALTVNLDTDTNSPEVSLKVMDLPDGDECLKYFKSWALTEDKGMYAHTVLLTSEEKAHVDKLKKRFDLFTEKIHELLVKQWPEFLEQDVDLAFTKFCVSLGLKNQPPSEAKVDLKNLFTALIDESKAVKKDASAPVAEEVVSDSVEQEGDAQGDVPDFMDQDDEAALSEKDDDPDSVEEEVVSAPVVLQGTSALQLQREQIAEQLRAVDEQIALQTAPALKKALAPKIIKFVAELKAKRTFKHTNLDDFFNEFPPTPEAKKVIAEVRTELDAVKKIEKLEIDSRKVFRSSVIPRIEAYCERIESGEKEEEVEEIDVSSLSPLELQRKQLADQLKAITKQIAFESNKKAKKERVTKIKAKVAKLKSMQSYRRSGLRRWMKRVFPDTKESKKVITDVLKGLEDVNRVEKAATKARASFKTVLEKLTEYASA